MKPARNYGLLLASQFWSAFGDNFILIVILGPIMTQFRAHEITAEALAASLLAALRTLRQAERFAHPFVEEFRLDRAIPAFERLIDQTIALKP